MTRASGKPKEHVPYTITTDLSRLPKGDWQAVPQILSAMDRIDVLFRRMAKQPTLHGEFTLDRSLGTDFYPANLTKDELTQYLKDNPDESARILNDLSVVRRKDREFVTIPYAEQYAEDSAMIATCLRAAARTVTDVALRDFLFASADAFISGNHDAADRAWLKVGAADGYSGLELNIGFHEQELDGAMMGVKRDVQAVFGLVNKGETAKLRVVQKRLQGFDAYLGVRHGYQPNPSAVNMIAIDQIGAAGTALYNYVPAAFILPNSLAFRRQNGAKQVFCWDVLKARLELVTRPIGQRVLPKEWWDALDGELFKLFVAAHECGHGTSFPFRGETFGALALPFEEARADVVGLHSILHESWDGAPEARRRAHCAVVLHLVDGLRRLRFGIDESHAVGSILQYNWLVHHEALSFERGKMVFVPERFDSAFVSLSDAFYGIFASKDPDEMEHFAGRWGRPSKDLLRIAGKFDDVPKDLDPQFNLIGLDD